MNSEATSIGNYIRALSVRHKTGIAREQSYRADLQNLLHETLPEVLVTNEPARIACGAPDYILTGKTSRIPIGYIEAKDIGKSLDDKAYVEQFDRYRKSLTNLLITDYMEFRLFREGAFVAAVKIAELANGRIAPIPKHFDEFHRFIHEFSSHSSQTITSAPKLAAMMAGKAKLLAKVIETALMSDEENKENTTLRDQMEAFRSVLLHDIDAKGFSDIYAQTIAYGMFAARLHDSTPDDFTRQEAAQLIPQTNPFLRKLFQYISGYDIDSRIEWIVDALADVFRATDLRTIVQEFGKAAHKNDPMIHFYETFLSEYDPALRRSRGVWYTPEPVVKFIVRAVDEALKEKFDLSLGIADVSKIKVPINPPSGRGRPKRVPVEETEIHKVQILDPATGTGTFLAEVVRQISTQFKGQGGIWSSYVEDHLVPRLNGFEILMAPYAVAHLKIDLLLRETGYVATKSDRLRIYLTNSLEEYHPDTGTLFASWLSAEANEANYIKRDTPVMVVLGNPPYSRHSMNKGHWLRELLDDYKREPNSNQKLKERNSKWLNDDYVKFMRYAQYLIDKSKNGIVAYITNHGFIDNPTFRGMRWSLLKSFNEIYVLDLHGNSNVSELAAVGLNDENVFDIKQGVAITIAIRTGPIAKNETAKLKQFDLVGTQEDKYEFLLKSSLADIPFSEVAPKEPYYFFRNRTYNSAALYARWPSLSEIFVKYSTGYYTSCDDIVIAASEAKLRKQIELSKMMINYNERFVKRTLYRPFDYQKIYYDPSLLTRAREKFVSSLPDDNIIILSGKSTKNPSIDQYFISDVFSELKCAESSKGSYMFPAMFGPQAQSKNLLGDTQSNLTFEVMQEYRRICGDTVSAKEIVLYIYSVLYSNAYRDMFSENLRDDFARIPFPKDAAAFEFFAARGRTLFELHRLRASSLDNLITTYPVDGNNIVHKLSGRSPWATSPLDPERGRVWINGSQYFDGVPEVAWDFSVGGYRPAQKWLKDRVGQKLTFEDIIHYQKMVVALTETVSVMNEIDEEMSEYLTELGASNQKADVSSS